MGRPLSSRGCQLTTGGHQYIFRAVRTMTKLRPLLSIAVSLWLALLPVMGSMALAKSIVVSSDSVSVSASHDCCDNDGSPLGNSMAECQASAGCTAKCFNFYGAQNSGALRQPDLPGLVPAGVSEFLHSHTAIPPFRPPRV